MAHFPSPYDSEKFDHERDDNVNEVEDGNPASRISNASGSTTATDTASVKQQHQHQQHNKDEDLENQQQQPLIGCGNGTSADGRNRFQNADKLKEKETHQKSKWSASTSTCSSMKIVIVVGIAALVALGIGVGLCSCSGCGASDADGTENEHQQKVQQGTAKLKVNAKASSYGKAKTKRGNQSNNEKSKLNTKNGQYKKKQEQENNDDNKKTNELKQDSSQNSNNVSDSDIRQPWEVQVDYNVISKYILNDFNKKPEDYNMSKFEPPSFHTLSISDREQDGLDESAKHNKHKVDIYMQYVHNELYDLDNGSWYASIEDINGGKYKYDPKNPPRPQRAANNLLYVEANIAAEYKGQIVDQVDLQSDQGQLNLKLKKAQEKLHLQKECFLAYTKMVRDGTLKTQQSAPIFTEPEGKFHPVSQKYRDYGLCVIPPAKDLSVYEPYAGFLRGRVISSEQAQLKHEIEDLVQHQHSVEDQNQQSQSEQQQIENQNTIDELKKELRLLENADNYRTYHNTYNIDGIHNTSWPLQRRPKKLSTLVKRKIHNLIKKSNVEDNNENYERRTRKLKQSKQSNIIENQDNNENNQGFQQSRDLELWENEPLKSQSDVQYYGLQQYKDVQDMQQQLYKSGKFSGPLGDNTEFSESIDQFFDSQNIPQKMLREKKDLIFSFAFQRGAGGEVDPSLLGEGTSVSDDVSVYSAATFLLAKEYIRETVEVEAESESESKTKEGEQSGGNTKNSNNKRYLSQSEFDQYCGDKVQTEKVVDKDKQKATRTPYQLFKLGMHFIEVRFATKKVIEQLTTNPKYNNTNTSSNNSNDQGLSLYQKLKQHIRDAEIENDNTQSAEKAADYFMRCVTAYIGHLQFLKDLQAEHSKFKSTYQKQMQNARSFNHGLAVMKFGSSDGGSSIEWQEQLAKGKSGQKDLVD